MAFRAGSVGPSAPAQQRVRYVRPELRLLERHTHRSGRDTVDHGRIGSDDFANSCCGVLRNLSNYWNMSTRTPHFRIDAAGALCFCHGPWLRLGERAR